MNASGPDAEENQINTLYRLREISRSNKFKAASYKVTVEQYENACNALREARKFESLIEGKDWPSGMEAIRKNLLRNTKFDAEVSANSENDMDVLDALLNQYRKLCPEAAPLKEKRFKEMNRNHSENNPGDTSSGNIPCTTECNVLQSEVEEGESINPRILESPTNRSFRSLPEVDKHVT